MYRRAAAPVKQDADLRRTWRGGAARVAETGANARTPGRRYLTAPTVKPAMNRSTKKL